MSSDETEGVKAERKIDIFLDHQTQRLEDIANNAIAFIRINLLILGVFAPFLATLLNDAIELETIVQSTFSTYAVIAWLISTIIAALVYRWARANSVSQFDTLEQAVVNDWRESDLQFEMLDASGDYESLTRKLMFGMSASISFSLIAVLFLSLSVTGTIIQFTVQQESHLVVMVFAIGIISGLGIEIISLFLEFVNSLTLLEKVVAGLVSRAMVKPGESMSEPLEEWISLKGSSVADNIISQKISYDNTAESESGLEEIDKELTPIRARVLEIIWQTVGFDEFTWSRLYDEVKEEFPQVGLTRHLLERLVDDGYLQKNSQKSHTFVFHERRQEAINPGNVEEAVSEEIDRFIDHIQEDEKARKILSNNFNIRPENIRSYLNDKSPVDQMRLLNQFVGVIKTNDEIEDPDYGQMSFLKSPNLYSLTLDSIGTFAKAELRNATKTVESGNTIESGLLAGRALEMFLQGLYREVVEPIPKDGLHIPIPKMLNELEEMEIIEPEERSMLADLWRIRNKSAHFVSEDIDGSEILELIRSLESFIQRHQNRPAR